MSNQLMAVPSAAAMSTQVDHKAVIAQVKAIQKIMSDVMKDGMHYGVIPGTKQPSLYKAGSEALLSAFHISVEPEIDSRRDGDHISYTVRCIGRHMQSGIVVGMGVGECSTAEEKYCWRAAVCEQEYDDTADTHRRVKWNKGYKGAAPWSVLQVRTNPADLANTCLKMAKKRAQIDLTLTSLSASDIFTQDVEDLPAEYLDDGSEAPAQKPNKYQPQAKAGAPAPEGPCTEGQVKLLKAKLGASGKQESELLAQFQIGTIEEMPKAKVNAALDWLAGK